MAQTWASIRAQARRLLQDDKASGNQRWTNTQLLDYIGWALDSFCGHTAIASSTGYTGDGATKAFPLPSNIYEELERSGAVYVSTSASSIYLNPVPVFKRNTSSTGYYTLPADTLNLVAAPAENCGVSVYYFAYYTHPVNDNDSIEIPSWAVPAILYRIASYAHSSISGKTAQIRQWNTKPDTGKPTDNPIIDESDFFYELYERELRNYPMQQRENYFRTERR